jgi:peptidoglycan lytic transglycosylase D
MGGGAVDARDESSVKLGPMCRNGNPRTRRDYGLIVLAIAGLTVLASCASTRPALQHRSFFLPPAPEPTPAPPEPLPVPPELAVYASEVPALSVSPAPIPRPTEAQFLIGRADDHFAAGKHALQEGRFDEARAEFNRAVETLLNAPPDFPNRASVESRLEELIEAIYRYDQDQLGAGDSGDEVTYDKRPLDDILNMTFPIDPSLRGKVREQVQMTVSDLPLEESDAVDSYINFFSTPKGRSILLTGMERSGRYKDMIERVLAEEGLPQELIFLAQAESGFLPRAISNKLCVGVWQFAKARGKEYGLEQTSAIDDRMDPEKATRAAARHLHDLYDHFGDWYLAMAAYNCGPNCVDSAVMRTGYADFWELRRKNVLPLQTANYVPAILAMIIMSKNAREYGLGTIDYDPAVAYDSLELQSPTHIALVAAAVDRPVNELKELNPALLKSVAPAGYTLRLPKGTLPQLEAALEVIPADRRDSWRVHRVEPGDTLSTVAKQYGASPELVSSANRNELPEAGEFLAVPVSYPTERPAPKAKSAAQKTGVKKPAAKKKSSAAKKTAAAPAHKSSAARASAKPASAKSSAAKKTSAKPSARASGAPAKAASGRAPGA